MEKIDLKKIGKFAPIIGLILFVYIIYDIGVDKIAQTFTLIPIYIFVLAFLPFFLRLAATAYKWLYMTKKQKMNFSYKYLVKIVLISAFYGNIIPGGLGWHMKIFYMRKKSSTTMEKCITFSILDSATGFMVGLILGLIGAYILIGYYPELFLLLFLFLLFYITVFFVFMKRSGGGKLFNLIIKFLIPKKYKEKLNKSIDALYEDIPRLRDMVVPIALEFVMWIALGLQVYIIALAFSIDIPIYLFIFLHAISVVAIGVLPISLGGLGIREGTFVFLMIPFGVPTQVAFVISFSGFLVKMLIPSILGLFFTLKEKQ